MSVSQRHDLYAADANGTYIGGITQQNLTANSTIAALMGSGEYQPKFLALIGQTPTGSFTTLAVKAALDLLGQLGWAITGDGFNFYGYKHAEGGTRAGAGSHKKYAMAEGLLVPRTLTCDHQGDATIQVDVAITWDGSANNPIVVTQNVSVPGGVTDLIRFTLGPVTIGGVALTQIRSVTIDFGLSAPPEGADSDLWATYVSIVRAQPMIRLRGIDVDWFKATGAIPLTGKPAAHADTTIYLRKRALGATFVANGTAEHIKITAAGLAHIDPLFDAGGGTPAETGLTLETRHDGTNNPLVIDTAAVIS